MVLTTGGGMAQDAAGERRAAINAADAITTNDGDPSAEFEHIMSADVDVIDHANRNGWTHWDLLDWVGSKNGRWYGETYFVGDAHSAMNATRYLTLKGVR